MTSNAQPPKVRTGQGAVKLSREEFSRRFSERFYDPEFQAIKTEVDGVIDVAWKVYDEYHKSPRTRKAGPEFQDPEFDLPIEWLETRKQIQLAEDKYRDKNAASRILLICGAARHDQTCPGEMSKTFRMVQLAREEIEKTKGFE